MGQLKYELKYLSHRICKHLGYVNILEMFSIRSIGGGDLLWCWWEKGGFMTAIVQAVVSRSTSRNDLINDSSKQLLQMLPIRGLTRKLFCAVLSE
jgi:hypothetical protein